MADRTPNDSPRQQPAPLDFNLTSIAGTGGWLDSDSEATTQATPHYSLSAIQQPAQQEFEAPANDNLLDANFDPEPNRPGFGDGNLSRTPFNDTTAPYSTPASNSGLNASAAPFSPLGFQHQNASHVAAESTNGCGFTPQFSQYAPMQPVGHIYHTPATGLPDGGLSPDAAVLNNVLQNIQYGNRGLYANDSFGPVSPAQEMFNKNAMSFSWQQSSYQTPPPTAQPPRQYVATPANMQRINQFSGQYPTPHLTNRLIQETHTEEDPTRVMGGLQISTMPEDLTPTRPQGTGSYSTTHLSCDFSGCDKSFDTPSELSHHQRNHTRPEDRPFACEPCGWSFIWEKDLNRHFRSYSHRRKMASLPASDRPSSNAGADNNESVTHYCPFPECRFHVRGFTRRDHYMRHLATHPGFEG